VVWGLTGEIPSAGPDLMRAVVLLLAATAAPSCFAGTRRRAHDAYAKRRDDFVRPEAVAW
jgi:hypothetical protein